MNGWAPLEQALDTAAAKGAAIRFWWRDDDSGHDVPALERLLDLAGYHGAPIALAVVPAWLTAAAHARIAASREAVVIQHGFDHDDHAPPGAKSLELGGRDLEEIDLELTRGREILIDAFGCRFLAVLAPPWNRIDPLLLADLPDRGYSGVSMFGPRADRYASPGLVQINTHLDPVDWRGSRLFIGEGEALAALAGVIQLDEPIGVLSHHLVMDEPGWAFLDQLLKLLCHHPGAQLCEPGPMFENAR